MARDSISIGGITVAAGQKAFGYLHVGYLAGRTEVRIPFQVIHGVGDGPTICIESTLHGWEPMGAEIIRRAMLEVDPATLRGTILCLPIANPFSIEFGGTVESTGQRVNPADLLDLNRVWPGKLENAWLTEQMAYVLWNEVVSKCQYLLDFHDGTGACDELPVAFPQIFDVAKGVGETTAADGVGGGSGAQLSPEYMTSMNEQVMGMARAFGARVVWVRQGQINPVMLSGQCLLNNIVALVVEAGGGGMIDETIDPSVTCTLNILKHLKMIDGEPEIPANQIVVDNYVVYRSRTGGFYLQEPGIKLGLEVTKGQLIGKVIDPLTSEVQEECRSPVNGIIISRRIRMPLNPGGYIAHIADTDAIMQS